MSSSSLTVQSSHSIRSELFPLYLLIRTPSLEILTKMSESNSQSLVPVSQRPESPAPPSAPEPPRRSQRPPRRTESAHNGTQCTSQINMCDECRMTYSRIPRNVTACVLDCPAGTHPVIFNCTFTGTNENAMELADNFSSRLNKLFSRQIPLHAGVRRRQPSQGTWHDLTTPGIALQKTLPPPSGDPGFSKYFVLPSVSRGLEAAQNKRWEKDYARVHSKCRELTMLVDFPFSLQPGGEMETHILTYFPSLLKYEEPARPRDGVHTCLFRLQWWERTHPLC
ncbi:uncharacterized protein BJX67DRAFT_362791 [Aspergillus lucknowensis]|uniref:Uncharacterized protein n=1 Tax=Aspergillus lucknowensis TaxID=176173 RepID=A0ABR4LHB6_9EURO